MEPRTMLKHAKRLLNTWTVSTEPCQQLVVAVQHVSFVVILNVLLALSFDGCTANVQTAAPASPVRCRLSRWCFCLCWRQSTCSRPTLGLQFNV
ncbi:hypothetical protein LSAT2_014263 [Lamellibrachia satsuma]|nr:hypothetical protein LSAT2_014263 [Lamellibrachia satsuma]